MSELKKAFNKDLILRERLAIQRTHLANQSTFLAFLRTSLYLLVAGLSTENLLKLPFDSPYMFLFFGLSALTLITGIINFFIHRKKTIRNEKHIGDYQLDYLQNHDIKN
jgi:putative membrane protein